MKVETMKNRVEKQLSKMGYSTSESIALINKYWSQCEYLSTARAKALFMVA